MCPHIAGNDCGCDRRTDRHTMHRFPRTADSSFPHTGFPVTWREHRVHRFQCIRYSTLGSHWSFLYRPFRTDSGCIRSHIPDTHQYNLNTDSLGSPSLVDVKSDKNSTSRCEITEGQTVCRNGFARVNSRCDGAPAGRANDFRPSGSVNDHRVSRRSPHRDSAVNADQTGFEAGCRQPAHATASIQ